MKKLLDLSNSKDLQMFKESLNNKIDAHISKKQLSEKIESLKGESFGVLNTLFESVLDELYDTDKGKKVIGSYIKLIKENKAIKSIYKVYESINSPKVSDSNVLAYVVADICENVNNKQLKEGEEKMYNIVCEALKHCDSITAQEIDNILSESKKINECVTYFSHKANKGNAVQINERVNNLKVLSDFINENKVECDEVITESKSNKELISDLHTLFENSENAWEKQTLMDLSECYMSGGNKSDLFENYKKNCITRIDELLEENSDLDKNSRLTTMKEQLNEKVYSEETLLDDLFKLAELNEALIDE